ncbi:PPE domain-containing protein [Mycobacterium sp. WMMD1722]|uniref:PPE domain-containing protein n=1 Tax=Mycobacterium sp. WMMD1722 TaxID=3404117 RepID=UPI003BF4E052
MAPVLEIDVDALNADGKRLGSLSHQTASSNAAPPGSDVTSLGAARALNEHELALIDVLNYAFLVRQTGGAVLRSAAVAFELADQAGADWLLRVDNTDAPPVAGSGTLDMPSLPPVPHQPPSRNIPTLPTLPPIRGDRFSTELHSGPGSADLRDFSRTWHNCAQDILHTSDRTRDVSAKVNEHWSTGDRAAAKISDHAKWLEAAAAWAERLSVAGEAVAHAFDVAKGDTPTPDEFDDAESEVKKAAALMALNPALGIIQYQRATARYAELYGEAEAAATQYHDAVSVAMIRLGSPIAPCPPIASGADIPDIPLPTMKRGTVPPDVTYVADQILNAPQGPPVTIGKTTKETILINRRQFVGGDQWNNKFGDLPTVDPSGAQVTYREYDRYPYTPGVSRGTDRIVVGSDGSRYFTDDHYKTFTKF